MVIILKIHKLVKRNIVYMYEYIKGKIAELTPAYVVIDNNGIAYFIHISLTTYTLLSGKKEAQVFLHQVIRDDVHLLYGFFEKQERQSFRLLISVSGIGVNTARMMLSTLTSLEINRAIISDDVNLIKSVKGIGLKTAQKVIIELKDKISSENVSDELFVKQDNTIKEEALSALVMLGFAKNAVGKVIEKIIASETDLNVETLIKKALKLL